MRRPGQYHSKLIYIIIIVIILTIAPSIMQARTSEDYTADLSAADVFVLYLEIGFTHIIPLGFDHILFILSLFLLSPKLKSIIWQATAFTVAHSITLGLAMFGWISAPLYIVEPVIALSIVFVAIENILSEKLRPGRILVVFGFGLIHGLGFAGALKSLGLPKKDFVNALVSFNVGVELGQISVILAAWCLFGKWFNKKPWYRNYVVNPLSVAIAAVALYWTIERVFLAKN